MPLLKAEAAKLAETQLERGVIEEIIETNPAMAMLPFMRVAGKGYIYNRENTLGSASFIDPNETVSESAATFTEVTAYLRTLIGDVDVDKFLSETMGDENDQTAIQVAAKAKEVSRMFQQTMITGDNSTNAKEFDGLQNLVTAGQTIEAGANGAAITFNMMDQLRDKVLVGNPVFMMARPVWRNIREQIRQLGGVDQSVQLENFGVTVPQLDGTPVLINDYMPTDEVQGSSSTTTSVYCVSMSEADGFHGIYGGATAGIRFEPIGTVQNKDADRYRVKWYCGVALKSTKAAARLKGVTVSG